MSQVLGSLAKGSFALGAAGFVASEVLYNVPGGHRGVMFHRVYGIEEGVSQEGTHFKIPLIQYPKIVDCRSVPKVIPTSTASKDLQIVNLQMRVLCRPDTKALPHIYKTLGQDFRERVLPSIGNEVLKATVAQYNADELLTMREKVSREIRAEMTQRAQEFDLILDDVSITHLTYGQEFTHAVEQKQVAHQEAERSKFRVMKAEQEKRAAVIRAEGEAQAAKLISDALESAGSGVIAVRRIDAARDVAETLSRSRNVTYLPGTSGSGGAQGGNGSNILLGINSQ